MKAHQTTVGKSQVYFTPKYIVEPLGRFDLDPCTSADRPFDIADKNICPPEDGLTANWNYQRIWLNPPFHRYERPKWMAKMRSNTGIMLIPAAIETASFKEHVLQFAHSILFLDHRPHFTDETGNEYDFNSGCSICLVGYGALETSVLEKSDLGAVWILKRRKQLKMF